MSYDPNVKRYRSFDGRFISEKEYLELIAGAPVTFSISTPSQDGNTPQRREFPSTPGFPNTPTMMTPTPSRAHDINDQSRGTVAQSTQNIGQQSRGIDTQSTQNSHINGQSRGVDTQPVQHDYDPEAGIEG